MPGSNYECTFAGDGSQALALVAGTMFDCVLVGHSVRGMDGLTLLRRIRMRNKFPPLVMLTGQARDDLAAAVLEARANNYIGGGIGIWDYDVATGGLA